MKHGLYMCLMTLSSACATTYHVAPERLNQLDGFRSDDRSTLAKLTEGPRASAHFVEDEDGQRHTFDEDTTLVLATPEAAYRGSYRSVDVVDGRLRALPSGPGRNVDLELSIVQSAEIEEFSWGKTTLLTSGIIVGVLAAVVTVALVAGDGTKPQSQGRKIPCGHGCEL